MLIIIEGIDGAGKNTQTQLLKTRFEDHGYAVGTLAFPRYGQTYFARSVAAYLNGAFGPIEAHPPEFPALLFAGDRFESKGLIEETIAAHDVVLIDRYVPSNLAHQAAKADPAHQAALISWIATLEYDVYGLPLPDLTLYLDIPVATAVDLIARKAPRDYTDAAADLHERDTAYLQACHAAYARLATTSYGGAWEVIACTEAGTLLPPERIAEAIWAVVMAHQPV